MTTSGIVVELLPAAALAQVVAAGIVDPAYASLINFGILVYLAVFTRREIATLRTQSVAAAAELVRMAKGSETRAENAASEITATKAKVEEGVSLMVITARRIDDRLKHLRGEWERLEESRHEQDDRGTARGDVS